MWLLCVNLLGHVSLIWAFMIFKGMAERFEEVSSREEGSGGVVGQSDFGGNGASSGKVRDGASKCSEPSQAVGQGVQRGAKVDEEAGLIVRWSHAVAGNGGAQSRP